MGEKNLNKLITAMSSLEEWEEKVQEPPMTSQFYLPLLAQKMPVSDPGGP